MNAGVKWTTAAAAEIGVPWLVAEIAPAGAFGRRARDREALFGPGDVAKARLALARVGRAASSVAPETLGSLSRAIAGAPDPSPAVARARGGAVLGDADFFELLRFLDACAEVVDLASDGAFADGAFADVARLDVDETLRATLAPGRTPQRTFYLDDAFSAALARVRGEAAVAQAAYDGARGRLAARVARALGREVLRDGEFVVMRDALAGPLPPELHVVREAATYLLCELALDEPTVAALSERDAAAARVADEEERVRAELSRAVAASADTLDAACDALGSLDAFAARARFAQRYETVVPEVTAEPVLRFEEARLLPLAATLVARGRRYTPISLDLDGMALLTGPNMGGKSAALRTCGFLTACVALGVPVPARTATVPLVDEIAWIGIGPAGEEDGLLSSFGREVVALREFLDRAPARALVLVDEFARTTSPRESRALLISLLSALRERRACGLAATHLDDVAEAAGTAQYAVAGLRELTVLDGARRLSLDEALTRIAEATDFRIARVAGVQPPRNDALVLAELLGLAELTSPAQGHTTRGTAVPGPTSPVA